MSPGLYRLMYRGGLPKEVSGIVLSRSFSCSQGNRGAVMLAITKFSQQDCLPKHQNVKEPMYQMFETKTQRDTCNVHLAALFRSLFTLKIPCQQVLKPWSWAPQPAIAPQTAVSWEDSQFLSAPHHTLPDNSLQGRRQKCSQIKIQLKSYERCYRTTHLSAGMGD